MPLFPCKLRLPTLRPPRTTPTIPYNIIFPLSVIHTLTLSPSQPDALSNTGVIYRLARRDPFITLWYSSYSPRCWCVFCLHLASLPVSSHHPHHHRQHSHNDYLYYRIYAIICYGHICRFYKTRTSVRQHSTLSNLLPSGRLRAARTFQLAAWFGCSSTEALHIFSPGHPRPLILDRSASS